MVALPVHTVPLFSNLLVVKAKRYKIYAPVVVHGKDVNVVRRTLGTIQVNTYTWKPMHSISFQNFTQHL